MMMGDWRDVAALLLLVHLVMLSEGLNVDGNSAITEILSKNVSIISMGGKADSLLDTEISNVMSLNSAYNNNNDKGNDSMVLEAAMKENVKILETELKEAIDSAAISGQVILLSPPADRTNLPKPPLIIIENPADISQSAMMNKLINETIEEPIPKLDQELAQSQNHENYKHYENSKNLEDLHRAIAEYEPQRIDARRIEGKNPQVSSEQADFDGRTMAIRPTAGETHYDVPKREEYPKKLHRISDVYRSTTTKPDLKVSSTGQVHLAAGPTKLDTFAIERKDVKAERRQFSSPSTFYHKPAAVPAKINSISPTSGTARANRHVDDNVLPRYVESSNRETQPLTNEQLGFLTRYNLPSLVTGKFASSRSYPVPSRNSRTGSTEQSRRGENQNDGRVSSETKNPRRSRTLISDPGSYEVNGRKNTNGKHVVDHPNGRRASNTIRPSVYDSYVEVEEETAPNNHRVDNTAYQRSENQPLPLTVPVYDAYEISPRPKPVRLSPIASTTPSHDFSEDYKESSSSKSAKDSQVESYEDYKEPVENSKIARNSLSTPREDYRKIGNSKIVRNTPVASREDYQESENSKISRTSPVSSYEDYRITENTEVVKNSPVVSPTPIYDFYEDYEESDGRRPLLQLQKLIINDPEPPQRVEINSHPVTIQSKPVQQPTPINLLNNPIYQLHGLKSTSLPINGVYKPYVNYSARNPSFMAPLEKQNTQAPRETGINQRVTYTTPLYDSHEDIAQANSPAVSLSRIPNQNFVENRVATPIYNGNNDRINSESVTPNKKYSEKHYRKRGSKQYAVSPVNTILTLPSQAVSQLRWDLNRANRVSPLDHVENSESEDYEESIDRGAYSSDTGTDYRNLRHSNGPHYQESHNQVSSTAASPTFDAHENGDRGIGSSTSNRAKLIEPHSADYGNRIRSRVVEERQQDRIVAPSSNHAFATTPNRRGTGRTASPLNDDESRLARKHVDEVPDKTVNQASVGDRPDYEDEVPASSGHEEQHENYKTHEEAKNGGGDEYKHEEGGGEKNKEDHHVSHGEKGEKGYKAWHEHDKGEKGHHDKESHDKEYDEKKGEKKKHEEESDYHKEHHHEEKGDKEAEFGEKGEHQKGHSTKGQHVVHKKDEYEKKTEFYDESHEEDDEEKEGGYGEEHEYEKGGHEKIGHHDSGHHEDKYGKKGEHEKGHHYHEHEGHKNTNGHNEHHHHEEKYGKKGGHEEGNKWSHEKGDNGKKSS